MQEQVECQKSDVGFSIVNISKVLPRFRDAFSAVAGRLAAARHPPKQASFLLAGTAPLMPLNPTMKAKFRVFSAFLVLLSFSSCAGDHWRIRLKDGSEYAATSQPEYQSKTGYYRYRNGYGKDALLRAEEVLLVERM